MCYNADTLHCHFNSTELKVTVGEIWTSHDLYKTGLQFSNDHDNGNGNYSTN